MKEAFGGTFTLRLLMVFFVIYVTFIGVALNFAKAYRIKNRVINILEQEQVSASDLESGSNVLNSIAEYLKGVPYNVPSGGSVATSCDNSAGDQLHDSSTGVCIIQQPGNYYKVIVYMYVEFPFLGIDRIIPISGETMTIVES